MHDIRYTGKRLYPHELSAIYPSNCDAPTYNAPRLISVEQRAGVFDVLPYLEVPLQRQGAIKSSLVPSSRQNRQENVSFSSKPLVVEAAMAVEDDDGGNDCDDDISSLPTIS